MKEEKEGFAGVSRLNVVQLHTIYSHIVMHTEVRIHLKKWKTAEKYKLWISE